MKKIYLMMLLAATMLLAACNDITLPSADYNRAQVANLIALPGDEQVVLSWEPYEGFSPDGYHLTWGDNQAMDVAVPQATITGLENDKKYTFTVQAVYGERVNSGQVSITCTPVTSRIAVSGATVTAHDGGVTIE